MFSLGSFAKNGLKSPPSTVDRNESDVDDVELAILLNRRRFLDPVNLAANCSCSECSRSFFPFSRVNDSNFLFGKNNLVERVVSPSYEPVFERQLEIVELAKALLGMQTCKVSLQGVLYSGKKSVVYGLAQKISKNLVPPRLRNYAILDVCNFLSDMQDFNAVLESNVIKANTIYLITNFETFLRFSAEKSYISQELVSLIKKPQIPTIVIQSACIDKLKYTYYLDSFFWTVFITDPSESQMHEILKIQAERVSKLSGCEFSDDILQNVQRVARMKSASLGSLSLIRKGFLVLDRIGSDFECKNFESSEMPTLKISKKNVSDAGEVLFQELSKEVCPSYIS